jgi:hypothetical protein
MRGKLIAFSIAKTWAGEWYTGEHLIVKRFIKLSSKAFRLYIRLVPQWTIAGVRKIITVRAKEENVCWHLKVALLGLAPGVAFRLAKGDGMNRTSSF